MRPDAAQADRRQSVRDAAREWLRSGWINSQACEKIEKMYPDDRVRAGLAFRILFFVLTLAAIGGLIAALCSQIINEEKTIAFIAITAGLACWATTNYLTGPARRREGGIEAAFSFAAIASLTIGILIIFLEFHWMRDRPAITSILFILAVLSGVAARIWGYWPYMAVSAGSSFFAVMTLPFGRILWIAAFAAIFPMLIASSDSGRLPPSLRKCAAAFISVATLALYAAVNVFLLDQRSLNWFHQPEFFPRWLAIILTATLPLLVLWSGIAGRRRLFIVIGFGLLLFSFLTLRAYVHVAPVWVILTTGGILLLVTAALLRRFLESGTEGERKGFTAAPLTGQPGKHRAVEILASVTALTPEPSTAPDQPEFRGGGGDFGGGGSSGRF